MWYHTPRSGFVLELEKGKGRGEHGEGWWCLQCGTVPAVPTLFVTPTVIRVAPRWENSKIGHQLKNRSSKEPHFMSWMCTDVLGWKGLLCRMKGDPRHPPLQNVPKRGKSPRFWFKPQPRGEGALPSHHKSSVCELPLPTPSLATGTL